MTAAPPRFSHREQGTAESVWWSARQWDDVPTLDIAAAVNRFSTVLVAAAHPDDETLGVGGLVSDLADLGMALTVVVASAGEQSHPGLDEAARARLGAARRREVERAVSGFAPRAHVVHLGLPDTGLHSHGAELTAAIASRAGADTLILAPWTDDGHSDHDALGAAAARAAAATGAVIAHFPIWLWHWGVPADFPWQHAVMCETSLVGCWRKRAALEAFTSQYTGLDAASGYADWRLVLGTAPLTRARRLIETLIDPNDALPTLSGTVAAERTSARTAAFDQMYDAGTDPWRTAGSFYEQRRRDLVLAILGHPRYRRVLEVGCADGYVTSTLSSRADGLWALDTSSRAVDAARLAAPEAVVTQGTVPQDLPAGQFDLVLLSEVGYFLTPSELIATLRRAHAALAPGGELVLCHWQHPTNDVPLDGVLVHEQARDLFGCPKAWHADDDLCIEVWAESPSVAEQEGRA